ncbi:MAG: tetraacyldisaccharide 4'-kinase [Parvularculaceae bacterium]|nr:tetraacyldisaccharide 4'-kinase [Parvularculaceae bacterium]
MSEPWFWRSETLSARMMRVGLMPAALLYAAGQHLRWRLARPFDPAIPVICVGGAVSGGAGKTPFCLLLQRLLAAEGIEAQFLTRGFGGSVEWPTLVTPQHTAKEVGDEALLLAAAAPTWVAKLRAFGAAAAASNAARLIIMDDGFQNPTVKKTLSFLLLTGEEDRLARFPAGPLRETGEEAMRRADAVALTSLPLHKLGEGKPPVFHTHTDIFPSIPPQPVAAFCGIARPERFFDALEAKGFTLRSRRAFGDHHPFTRRDIAALKAEAAGAPLITTEKDYVRLSPADRAGIAVAALRLEAKDPAALVRFIRERIGR